MAARKGKGRQAVRNNSGGMPGWGWAVIGILIGAVLMFAMRGHLPMAPTANDGPQPNAQATAQRGSDAGAAGNESTSATDNSAAAPKKPQYDFYSVLSEKEVRIPDAVISAQAKAEQQQKQQAAQQAAQAAAQQQAQAAAQKPAPGPAAVSEAITPAPESAVRAPAPTTATPAATGGNGYLLQVGAFPSPSDAETLKAKLAMQGFVANVSPVNVNGQTYNRVRLGPFHSATELESAKQRLASAGINAIALKEGK
ncbi:Sporulation related domain-containing protein [Dyella jiangningensis]|uniref:SPOR domain-containing protein n=1 Tax=Dyella sp. AtDHG13 TaxID=1938897 RepID=UPI000890CD06|nr:SPOR domain-containing protein [Dyella sp. AtDHG13]PXV53629.1 sporulation related protein [Dyella sp. AtDHG13]SDL23520.1 Sporulation related domain-containing protein [Dyella jiangningensis]